MSRRYTYPEAAERLRVEERWLRRNIRRLPHSKKGRVVTFSDEDLDRIDALHHHEPTSSPLATLPVPAPGTHPMAHLKPLPPRGAAVRIG
ncbi:helix-turn-helix domain-containing protein [Streptomyces sp. PKU-MA01144]|uniref:Helix-turn-helix domain-containing protein n=1 Tax=Streptomyces marianii TaxID=1817406 RepID=A0A5R9ECJ0_9ACTN|nr:MULTISPECIES: helix-turn-helix domain-containing protein [Streptomyces]NNJ04193.1 helix-turn-helix domain-containing protein [Streptomyces sp. PKU-MA01144]TLQ45794.1 helix-turn-helix domain-containing protein [Streptomyces marianii]